jgi:TonB family protein
MKTFLGLSVLLAGAAIRLPAAFQAAEIPAAAGAAASDSVLKVIQTAMAVYPTRLLDQGISRGEASVVFRVGADGRLIDWMPTAYTHRGFADEAVRVLKQWRFEAGRVHGRPVASVGSATFDFQVSGILIIQKHLDTAASAPVPYAMRHFEYEPCPPEKLDRSLTVTRSVNPTYPKELSDRGAVGTVRVAFYVDETGRTRFPIAVDSANDFLSGIAIAAISKWEFDPPTSKGVPVLVRASVEFSFVPSG